MDHDNLLASLHDNPALRNVDKQLLQLIDTYTKRLRETIQSQNDLIHVLRMEIRELKQQIERGF